MEHKLDIRKKRNLFFKRTNKSGPLNLLDVDVASRWLLLLIGRRLLGHELINEVTKPLGIATAVGLVHFDVIGPD